MKAIKNIFNTAVIVVLFNWFLIHELALFMWNFTFRYMSESISEANNSKVNKIILMTFKINWFNNLIRLCNIDDVSFYLEMGIWSGSSNRFTYLLIIFGVEFSRHTTVLTLLAQTYVVAVLLLTRCDDDALATVRMLHKTTPYDHMVTPLCRPYNNNIIHKNVVWYI